MARKEKSNPVPSGPQGALPTPRLKKKYAEEVAPKMLETFKYSSVMQVPRLEKIVINMGTGAGDKDPKHLDNSVRDMTLISGQKPVVTVAKKAVSNFKVREGMKIGCKVTLRGNRMWHFYDKLVTVVLPEFETSRASRPSRSTAVVTTRWALKSSSFFRKSHTIRSTEFAEWTSSSARRRRRTKRDVCSSRRWASPFARSKHHLRPC